MESEQLPVASVKLKAPMKSRSGWAIKANHRHTICPLRVRMEN